MADTPEPGAALLDRPAAAANGHGLDAPVGCSAPGDRHQAPAHPAQGFTGAGQVARNREQIFTVVPGLAAPARCPACGTDVGWSQWQRTGTRRDGTAPQMAGVIIVGVRGGALPGLALSLDAAVEAIDLRDAPGGRHKATFCRNRARAIAGRPGMARLPGRPASASGLWSMRRDGPDWVLEAGPERARLRDTRGLHHLRALLAAPGLEIPALHLAAGGGPGLAAPATQPVLDTTARSAYRRRIHQLDADLAAADRAGDPAAAERAHAERQALVGELRRATGLAGRPRRAAAEAERARINVTRTLRAAIDAITAAAPLAGAHLQASIRTGTACRYQPTPDGPARWHT